MDFIKQVEKALGFKLYDWQKAYILDKGLLPVGGRKNGKTLAVMLKCMMPDLPDMKWKRDDIQYFTDGTVKTRRYDMWYENEFKKLYFKLKDAGVELRKIEF